MAVGLLLRSKIGLSQGWSTVASTTRKFGNKLSFVPKLLRRVNINRLKNNAAIIFQNLNQTLILTFILIFVHENNYFNLKF